jgi:hypothetical protein
MTLVARMGGRPCITGDHWMTSNRVLGCCVDSEFTIKVANNLRKCTQVSKNVRLYDERPTSVERLVRMAAEVWWTDRERG